MRELKPLTYDEADEVIHRLVGAEALSADIAARLLMSISDAPPAVQGREAVASEVEEIADEVERIVFVFNVGDSRRHEVRQLAQRIRALACLALPSPEGAENGTR